MSTQLVLDTEGVTKLAAIVSQAVIIGLTEAGVVSSTVSNTDTTSRTQRPKGEGKAKRSASPKGKSNRTTKPLSTAQHARGRFVEIAFGIDANGNLSSAQQSRARQIFADLEGGPYTFPKGTITMAMIRKAVREVNASLRGANEVTWSYWAVFNGGRGVGRISDYQARQFMAKQRS